MNATTDRGGASLEVAFEPLTALAAAALVVGLCFAAGVVIGVEIWGRLTTPADLRPTPRRRRRTIKGA